MCVYVYFIEIGNSQFQTMLQLTYDIIVSQNKKANALTKPWAS